MTDLLRAEVIEALAKELETGEFFHDGLSADLMETKDKAHAYVEGYRAAADVIRSFDLSRYRVTVPEDIKPIALLHDDGYWTWKGNPLEEPMKGFLPIRVYPHEVVESLAAQVAEYKRRIAELERKK